MIDALVMFVILLIVVCLVAYIILWAVRQFFPAVYEPAKLLVGAVALIVILLQVAKLASHFSL